MCLAAAQVHLLFLTSRKADCEVDIAILAARKMANTREAKDLAREKQSRMQQKKLAYYSNGDYHKLNYAYLMGNKMTPYSCIDNTVTPQARKDDNSVVLTDYNGRVVLSKEYGDAIIEVLGGTANNILDRGGSFSKDKIPEILAKLVPGYTAEQFKEVIEGGSISSGFSSHNVNSLTGENTGTTGNIDTTDYTTQAIERIVDFYYPIFQAAAANGWTSEYNDAINENEDYLGDAINSGIFQLAQVDDYGNYDADTSLTYFLTNGFLEARYDSEVMKQIEAWYEAEKAEVSEKEDALDVQMADLSTELEAINTEIESVKSFISDAIESVFDWGG